MGKNTTTSGRRTRSPPPLHDSDSLASPPSIATRAPLKQRRPGTGGQDPRTARKGADAVKSRPGTGRSVRMTSATLRNDNLSQDDSQDSVSPDDDIASLLSIFQAKYQQRKKTQHAEASSHIVKLREQRWALVRKLEDRKKDLVAQLNAHHKLAVKQQHHSTVAAKDLSDTMAHSMDQTRALIDLMTSQVNTYNTRVHEHVIQYQHIVSAPGDTAS
ncbi:hypothetical protein CXG81DRAFT_20422 [Caulochytrium protostelioides]|uniref:Uncharacterized protein n=1 Tax=Caulochytrium protostelioides TaxID=1555241 RepID=A0A4P9X3B8_9FUNG|nr:hypothetical protein CXG81DRAFT_20422 [Caulochytrium protostelioides]|eukprot:RKO99512.1 hypothetical protein CXG81DRAFT_20422 [Caulochytrium protostelioides]